MAQLLDEAAIRDALSELSGWTGDTQGIHRTVQAPDFPTAIRIVDEVAVAAEERDHHPDIDIRWRTLRFVLTTHSAGGVTGADIQLAKTIDAIAAAHSG